VPDLEDELDRLYGLPLEDFTRTRNDLASRLSKAGQKDVAAEVKALAKPSVPVWAVNQLARREPGEVRALLKTGEEVRETQARTLRGGGGEVLRAKLAEQRNAVRALARLARDVLADEGRTASDATIERIAKTLDAAAVDEQARPLLEAGRLTEELEPAGFDETLATLDDALAVHEALAAAPGHCREVLDRFFCRDESYATIGAALDLPPGTIASRISRCLARLRDLLEGKKPVAKLV
jgi:DNA-directed RNA polymerase specialized sigma24 family protein